VVYGPGFFVEDCESPIIDGGVENCGGIEKGWHIDIGHQFCRGFLASWVCREVETCAAEKTNFIEDVMEGHRLDDRPRFGAGDRHAGNIWEMEVHIKSVNAEVRTDSEHRNKEH
jgi:hypothetical protein